MMAKQVYIFLAEGFEELEAVAPYDVLKRNGNDVYYVSLTDRYEVRGAHGTVINAHRTLSGVRWDWADMLVFPGGFHGVHRLVVCEELKEGIRQRNRNCILGAICGAPRLLGEMGLLDGLEVACHPTCEKYLHGVTFVTDRTTVTTAYVITSQSYLTSIEFAEALGERLNNSSKFFNHYYGMSGDIEE